MIKQILNKMFPCDEKLEAAYKKHKQARDDLIVEIREATDKAIQSIKENNDNTKVMMK